MDSHERKLKARVAADNHHPTIEELFEQGYTVQCFCGKRAITFDEFVAHDETMKEYYQKGQVTCG